MLALACFIPSGPGLARGQTPEKAPGSTLTIDLAAVQEAVDR